MKTLHVTALLAACCLASISTFSAQALGDNIPLENQGAKWKSGGTAASPLIVQAQKGDVIEIKVMGPHAFVTLDKKGNESPSQKLDLVLACGEDQATKPNAALREMDCGSGGSIFKKQLEDEQLTGPMRLEVTDKFQADVHFWCVVHQSGMWGTFRPKP
jgi:hypothetical protein